MHGTRHGLQISNQVFSLIHIHVHQQGALTVSGFISYGHVRRRFGPASFQLPNDPRRQILFQYTDIRQSRLHASNRRAK